MSPAIRLVALGLATLAIAGCTMGGPPRTPRKVIDRALRDAPYAAQPSLIVAREIEFARAAREDGQWTASLAFATDDALLHGRDGPAPAKAVLGSLADPDEAVQWVPRVVMMSCDGMTAVSQGRYLDPEGNVGTFVTVWERANYTDDYKWSYDVGVDDDPQPPRKEAEEGVLVVTAYDTIQGLVADCPTGGEQVPPPEFVPSPVGGRAGDQVSGDGTLRWRWEHRGDGTKHVRADYYTSGAWEKVIDQPLPASPPR